MIPVKKVEDILPLCPHCQAELNEVWFREMKGNWGPRYIYFCPMCRKVLGVTHRKGPMLGL